MKFLLTLIIGCLLTALAACKEASKPAPAAPAPEPPTTAPPLHLTNAQPRLQTIKLYVGAAELNTEIALKQHEIATGMMFRTNMTDSEGMLFVFGQPHRTAFYMKNTTVPLSAAYIGPDGTILEIHDLHPLNEKPVEAGTDNVQYVLEVPQGWFKRHNVSTGAVIRSQFGSLPQTFRFQPRS